MQNDREQLCTASLYGCKAENKPIQNRGKFQANELGKYYMFFGL